MAAVKLSNLGKSYGKVEALRNVNLSVPEGAIYGIVGSNGAGKTTLIRTMLGITKPSSGRVRVLNRNPLTDKKAVRRDVGYMPQDAALYTALSVLDNVKFFAKLRSVEQLDESIKKAIAITDLSDRARDPIHTLSGGMKKRVALACAIVHRPTILFLDEPTAAVDPGLRVLIRPRISCLKAKYLFQLQLMMNNECTRLMQLRKQSQSSCTALNCQRASRRLQSDPIHSKKLLSRLSRANPIET